MVPLIHAAAVGSMIWGVANLVQVIIGKWDTPMLWRTVYCAATTIAGFAILGQVGLQGGVFFLIAGIGALQHLSASLVHIGFCLTRREAKVR